MVLKQSTAKSLAVFMASSTDHVTGKTGLTLTITASKDAAAFGSITPTVTELATGWYKLALTTSHTDTLGDLALHITGTGADPTDLLRHVVAYDFTDAVRLGLTALPNAAAEASGGLPTLSAAQASNGTVNANVHRWLTGTPNALQSGRVDGYLGAVASGVIAAASFAANALDAVWSTATRVLTAATNLTTALATPTNITAGTITTVTNVTNAPTSGDLTATMKTSVTTAATAATPTAAAVTGAVGSVTGNVGGNVAGSVGSVTGLTASNLDATVSSRLATLGYTAPDNASSAAAASSAASAATDASTLVGRLTAIRAAKLDGLPEGIKKNTALANFTFFMTDSTTHAAAPGLTVTATRRLDNGSFSACANAPTEIANGYYTIDFAAADLNGDMVCVRFSATGADDAGFEAKLSA